MNFEAGLASSTDLQPIVHVVDDDATFRDALSDLLASADLECRTYASPEELLATPLAERPSCLILDVQMPGGNGLELQAHLNKLGEKLPIIFMTGYGDVESCARAMKRGAVEFLTKPFRQDDMLEAISVALASDRARRAEVARRSAVERLLATLTKREAEVLWLVVEGLANKQIAREMGIAEVTVKLHRGNVMQKMAASSLADLVRKAAVLRDPNTDAIST